MHPHKKMNMEARHLRNFIVYFITAALLLAGLIFCKSRLHFVESSVYALGAFVIFLKLSLKVLPLLAALAAEWIISSRGRTSIDKFKNWKRSSLIDLYSFILNNIHKLAGWLNILFSFGIAWFFEQAITRNIPEQFRLFVIIERHANFLVAAIVFVAIVSFFSYWEHRVWHTRLFWPIHRFHHSATEFNALTNTRNHFTEILLTPLFFTLPVSLLGAPLEFMFYYLAFMQYQGFMSHIDEEVSYGWIGRNLWTDPLYHKLHHSSSTEHINKNFSGTLPLWDRLFGTHVYDHNPVAIGVADGEHYARLSFVRICLKDFFDFLGNIRLFLKQHLGRRGNTPA